MNEKDLDFLEQAIPELADAAFRRALGGHSVPREKTIARYERSLSLLMPAIRCSDRAYIFDNSQHLSISWIAEISDGKLLVPHTNEFPAWFKKVLDGAN